MSLSQRCLPAAGCSGGGARQADLSQGPACNCMQPGPSCSLSSPRNHHLQKALCFFYYYFFSPGIFVARLIFLQQQKLKSYLPAPDGRLGRNVCESAQSFGPWDSSRQTIFPLGGSQMLRGSLHCWKERLHSRFTRAS